ncbi:MAG TPA: flagellar basal-body MS-ring/collar protein FliF, partial [bacterium]|nr:flagellar basal-body MS-ring/collar protein FliF [bacterium]
MDANGAGQNLSGFTRWWNELPPNSRLLWGLLSALLLAVVAFLGMRVSQPEYVVMYSGLTQEDSAAMADVLRSENIPFRLSDTGDALLVPAAHRDEARLAVAGEGVLPAGPKGYEILDSPSPFSLSDFSQRVNLQRAREGELARTLMSLEGVQDARVLLNLPDDSPFLGEKSEPGASVALTLRGRQSLAESEAQTIANLVAAAVPELDPRNVVIVDQYANLLSGPHATGLASNAEGKSVVETFETRVEEKVRKLLEAAYGGPNVRVAVTASLDLDRVTSTKETFAPDGDGRGIPRSEEITETTSKGGMAVDEGIAGTSSNIPSYPTPEAANGSGASRSSSTVTNYEISSVREVIEKAPGEVKRLSVSVLLDQPTLAPELKSTLEESIKAAINFDAVRGDMVSVAAIPYSTELEEQLAADLAQARRGQQIEQMIQIAGWAIVVALFAWGT